MGSSIQLKKNIYIGWLNADGFDYKLNSHYNKIMELSRFSKLYRLTEHPSEADLIILVGERFNKGFKNLFRNETLKRYSNKAFLLSLSDFSAQRAFRGVYASASNSILNFNRILSTSYTIFSDSLKNPYITTQIEPLIERKHFISFLGRNSHRIRNEVFNMKFFRNDIVIRNTSNDFDLFTGKSSDYGLKVYYETLINSKFSLCPRGVGLNSIRLFESMKMGVVPIIISDNFMLPKGPVWKNFSIVIKEKNIASLEQIALEYESDYYKMGSLAKIAYDDFFDDKTYFDHLMKCCFEVLGKQAIPESFYFTISNFFYQKLYPLFNTKQG